MTHEYVRLELAGRVARLTLARADKLNPLDWATVRGLKQAVAAIEAQPQLSFVVLTGDGRAFSAGGDLDGYLKLYRDPAAFREFLDDFHAMLNGIEKSRAVWIAAVNGACVAGGLELLLACDMAIAARSARIGDGHVNFGQLPGAGGSQRLPRAIGLLRAKHLMLTGDLLDADVAERWGLVTMVAEDATLMATVDELIERLASKSPAGISGAKRLANMTLTRGYEEGLREELDFVHAYATGEPDATEGLEAFREKRAPRFGVQPKD
jgi:enoyl-CoA hydratase/carnithine racemase